MAGLIISPRARIFQGHDWVYGTEVRKIFGNPQPGDVVALKDFKDRFLGSAMFNPHSQIVARRFSRRKQELNGDFFSRRISQAVELRRRRLPEETLTRLVWSESDGRGLSGRPDADDRHGMPPPHHPECFGRPSFSPRDYCQE